MIIHARETAIKVPLSLLRILKEEKAQTLLKRKRQERKKETERKERKEEKEKYRNANV